MIISTLRLFRHGESRLLRYNRHIQLFDSSSDSILVGHKDRVVNDALSQATFFHIEQKETIQTNEKGLSILNESRHFFTAFYLG